MFRKLLRLFYTLRYIRSIQLRYQFWYRVKNRFISIHWYKNYVQRNFITLNLQVPDILHPKRKEYLGENCFVFIGLQKSFGDRIDWNYNGNGKLWNYNLQYFSYLLDEDIPYEERLDLLRDFSRKILSAQVHPEPYPVSLRIVNTLIFHSRYPITDSEILESLQKQIDYLANNLEYHLLANHLLENLFSLYIASIFLTDNSLYSKSYSLLEKQLEEQILADGGHYECSPMYQSILLSKLLLSIEVTRKSTFFSNKDISQLETKASKMLSWLLAYSFPDGSWALMNDAANNIAPTTAQLVCALKELAIAYSETELSNSGFYKMIGDGWELIIKTGEVQPSYQPGHTHSDIGTFCLWYKGKQYIIDPGITTYSTSKNRIIERSTASHNTVSVNGENQSDVWSSFRIAKRANVCIAQKSNSILAIQIYSPVTFSFHYRTFAVYANRLVITDSLKFKSQNNKKEQQSTGSILFSPHIKLEEIDSRTIKAGSLVVKAVDNELIIEGATSAEVFNNLQVCSRIKYHVNRSATIELNFL